VAKYDAREIQRLFEQGCNITSWIKAQEKADNVSQTAILYSYDAQAGSYIKYLNTPGAAELKESLGRRLGEIINELGPKSILEAGVGEATSLVPILNNMTRPEQIFAFDLSLSRLLFARKYLQDKGWADVKLFSSDLERIALASGSVDVVITVHAIEPNGGRELMILSELLRVARMHLVMIEPSYEFASEQARARMDRLGYIRGLPEALTRLGQPARLIERWPYNANPLNEAAIIVVDKKLPGTERDPRFISPISARNLTERHDCWFCPKDGHAFPIIAGIPCLTVENAVLASKLDQF
jgi:uncharacterized protein YbaR (Trm112 family)